MANHKRKDPASAVLLVILVAIFIALAVLLVYIISDPKASIEDSSSNQVSELSSEHVSSSSVISLSSVSEGSSSSKYPDPEDPSENWYLTLANKENPLPEGFSIKTSVIKSEFNPYTLKFDARAVDALNQMLSDAKAEGVKIQVISAYRTMEKQTSLYNNKVKFYKDKGYGDSEAKTAAATVVAIPGTSEHNLGLAVDFDSVETTYEKTVQFRWLQNNCTKYGFVMRYPKDKQDITGYTYEPWHYRYVGVKAAKEMTDKGMCLEEYTEYLKTK